MAAIIIVPCLMLFTVVLAMGWLYQTRQTADQGADALAIGYGNQMVLWPEQLWSTTKFDTQQVAVTNGMLSPWRQSPAAYYLPAGFQATFADTYLPRFVQTNIQLTPPSTGLDGMLSTIVGVTMPTAFTAQGMARVNNVQLGSFYPIREQVIFMFDYSRSMRLHYTGGVKGTSGPTGLEIMREAAATVLQNYNGFADMAVYLFSDGLTNSNVGTNLPQTRTGSSSASQSSNNTLQQTLNLINNSPTTGDGTDIAAAVEAGLTEFRRAASDTSSYASIQHLVIVTDGEPDAGKNVDANLPYSARVSQAISDAQVAISRAWSDGVLTSVAYLQRQQGEDDLSSQDVTFLRSIAGARDPCRNVIATNSNMYLGDAGDSTQLAASLNSMPHYTYCISDYEIDSIPGRNQSVPSYLLPTYDDVLTAYFDTGMAQGQPDEIVIGNIYPTFELFYQSVQASRAVVSVNGYPNLTDLRTSSLLGIFLDPSNHKVLLNPLLCAAFLGNMNKDKKMRVRLRWGAPRNVERTMQVDR